MEANQNQDETVGVYEAKSRLSELLDRVAAGCIVVITRHGTPVARLVPPTDAATDLQLVSKTLRDLRLLGEKVGFGFTQEELREAIDEGRL